MPIALTEIIRHVPVYVWGILALLLWLGVRQSRDQQMRPARVMILPLVWLVYGLWGVVSAFGAHSQSLLPWMAGCIAALLMLKPFIGPEGSHFNPQTQLFFVPGSWLPLGLMMVLFTAKFALGMYQSMHAERFASPMVAAGFSALLGFLGGAFLARSRRILSSRAVERLPLQVA